MVGCSSSNQEMTGGILVKGPMANILMFPRQAKTTVKMEIGILNSGDITVVNIYAANTTAINYVKPKLQEARGGTDRN